MENYIEFAFKTALKIKNLQLEKFSEENISWEDKETQKILREKTYKISLEKTVLEELIINLKCSQKIDPSNNKMVLSLITQVKKDISKDDLIQLLKIGFKSAANDFMTLMASQGKPSKQIVLLTREFNHLMKIISESSVQIN
jgi:hypothetical protein